jgi:nucleoside-diphosphate-sugar epimerase
MSKGQGNLLTKKINQGIFELLNPNDTRSFCYVADSVRAIIKVADLADKEIINVGSDEEITVQEAANIIAKSQESAAKEIELKTFNKGIWIDINNNNGQDVLKKEKTEGFNKDLFNG